MHLEPGRRAVAPWLPPGGDRADLSRDGFFGSHDGRSRTDVERSLGEADLRRIVRELIGHQAGEPVDYVEVRVSPRRWMDNGMDPARFLQVVHAELDAAGDPIVRGVVVLNRSSPPPEIDAIAAALEAAPATIVGVDVAGDESDRSADVAIAAAYGRARSAGLGATAHAGEWGPAERIWHAVDVLGVSRVGHALSAVDDAALVRRLASDGILVEVSISSNLALGAVGSVEDHPAGRLAEAGVPLGFNSDIPMFAGTSMDGELRHAAAVLGCSRAEVERIQAHAAAWAFGAVSRGPAPRRGNRCEPRAHERPRGRW